MPRARVDGRDLRVRGPEYVVLLLLYTRNQLDYFRMLRPHFCRHSSPYIALEARSRRSADAKETRAAPGKDLVLLHARQQVETPAMTVIALAVH